METAGSWGAFTASSVDCRTLVQWVILGEQPATANCVVLGGRLWTRGAKD